MAEHAWATIQRNGGSTGGKTAQAAALSQMGPIEMTEMIVKDNFFKADLSNLIVRAVDACQWSYNHKSDMNNPAHNKFFVSYLWTHSSEDNFFHMLWKLIHKQVPSVQDYYCWRIIANGQVKGQNGNWHADHGDKTVLYFPIEWAPQWGGSTHFKIGDSATEIQNKQNRILIFDSNIPHYGSGPTVDNILRISIAFNLRTNKAYDPTKETGSVQNLSHI